MKTNKTADSLSTLRFAVAKFIAAMDDLYRDVPGEKRGVKIATLVCELEKSLKESQE